MVRNRAGFTLVEIMTVVAIIAILAAILLPVLGKASENSRRTECQANLHQIGTAIKLYKLDWRAFPLDLVERPIPAGEHWFGPADAEGLPTGASAGYGLASLYPDYVSATKSFRCPNNEVDSVVDADDPDLTAYVEDCYISYDGRDPLVRGTEDDDMHERQKYRRNWLADTNDPDYRRQLSWKYPPDDTVITWCSMHRDDPTSPTSHPSDRDIVLFLDGSTRTVPSNASEFGHRLPAAE